MDSGWIYIVLGAVGFIVPVASALVVTLASGGNNGGEAFVIALIAGIFNQIPFLGLAFQLSRSIDPWGKKIDKGNKSHRNAVIVELISLLAINVLFSVGISKTIMRHSPFVGFNIIVLPLVSCVAMALGYLLAYVAAEFLSGLCGEEKKAPRR